jgi:hypothetical protein
MSNFLRLIALIAAFAPTIVLAAMVTEPGRNGQVPAQVEPNAAPGASPASGMDAPGGVGPGFTNRKDQPPGLVAPGAIGKNGIAPADNAGTR